MRLFFTRIFMTASHLRSPGLFSVFWPLSTMQSFGWSRYFFRFLIPLVFFQGIGYRSESTNYNWYLQHPQNCIFSSLARFKYLSLISRFFFKFSLRGPPERQIHWLTSSFSCWLSLGLVFWMGLSNPFVSQNPIESYAYLFSGQILVYIYGQNRFWFVYMVRTDSGLCIWSNFNLLHSLQWIIFPHPVVPSLVLLLILFVLFLLFYSFEFFTPALADGLSLESEQ